MKEYNVEHLIENDNIDRKTECLCLRVVGANRRERIHDHDFYEIFLVSNPTMHFINGKTERLERGTLVFIKPSDIHGILYDEDRNSEIINFTFSNRLMGLILEFLDISRTFVDNMKRNKIMLDEFETQRLSEKLNGLTSNANPDVTGVRCVLFGLAAMFLNKTVSEEKTFPKWFENMCGAMREKENFCAGSQRLTELSGRSREYISRSMKKYLGITPTEFVNDLRLNYAASQIVNTDKNITDICLEAGFYSISWFNKMFLKKYSISPKEFRKKGKEL